MFRQIVTQISAKNYARLYDFFLPPLTFNAPVREVPVRIFSYRLLWKNENGVATYR